LPHFITASHLVYFCKQWVTFFPIVVEMALSIMSMLLSSLEVGLYPLTVFCTLFYILNFHDALNFEF